MLQQRDYSVSNPQNTYFTTLPRFLSLWDSHFAADLIQHRFKQFLQVYKSDRPHFHEVMNQYSEKVAKYNKIMSANRVNYVLNQQRLIFIHWISQHNHVSKLQHFKVSLCMSNAFPLRKRQNFT